MRPHRPDLTYPPDARPPIGLPTVACTAAVALAILYALTPLLALSGLFAAAVCVAAIRESR